MDTTCIALLVVLATAIFGTSSAVPVSLENGTSGHARPWLPPFLGGKPEPEQVHIYSSGVNAAPHEAYGKGLHHATVGVPASFKIRLADEKNARPHDQWNVVFKNFIYVWIANADQIFIAEVVNNGDGTLTATYESSFPGTYSVYIEVVELDKRDEGVPIIGTPFALTIDGEPSLDIEELPVCGTEEEDIGSTFWRPGTWVSSNLASATHGVMRDGWVFQPKTCVYDAFSYEDLMLLAELEDPTWLLVLGGSIQRGVFLTIVDMALAKGQKDNFDSSALAKCWGFADIHIGNLRITYQDFRLYTVSGVEDTTVCNDEKLESGSTAMYVRSCKHFLDWVIFQEGTDWPTVIFTPSHMVDDENAPNVAIEVVMGGLPASWDGDLIMVDHMAGFGNHWGESNPTRTALNDVDLTYHRKPHTRDNGLGKMAGYQKQDRRTSFISVFPMEQAKLFENQNTRHGKRQYGGSVHYHYMTSNSSVEAYSGAKMVQSTMTEMISNIIIAKAVGTKEALYAYSAAQGEAVDRSTSVRETFQMCTDCPSGLLPFHVQPKPKPVCATLSALPGNAPKGQVWDNELCPEWCMETEPRQDQTFDKRYWDKNANALLNGAREEDGGGSGIAIKTTADGACFFNAACTGLFGGEFTEPSETNHLALPLRVSVIRHGAAELETLIGNKHSYFRRFDAYDGNVQEMAGDLEMDIKFEMGCDEDVPVLKEDIARACLVAALLSIGTEFSEGSNFCLPLLADVTRVNIRCFYPGSSILVRPDEYAQVGSRWFKLTFSPAGVEATTAPLPTVRMSMSYFSPVDRKRVPFNSLQEFKDKVCWQQRFDDEGDEMPSVFDIKELKHFVSICPGGSGAEKEGGENHGSDGEDRSSRKPKGRKRPKSKKRTSKRKRKGGKKTRRNVIKSTSSTGANDARSGGARDNSCPSEGGDGESGSGMAEGNLSETSAEDWTPPKKGSGNKQGKKKRTKRRKSRHVAGVKDDGSGSSTDNSCPDEGGDGESGSDMDQGNLSQASS